MFSFKANHYLPALFFGLLVFCWLFLVFCFFFLTTAFPRQLAYLLFGNAEHWRIHWKTENLLCFSTYISAAQLNASTELTAKAACLTEPGSGQLCWRRYQQEDPILQTSHTHSSAALQLEPLISTGRGKQISPIPKEWMGSSWSLSSCLSQEGFQDTARCHRYLKSQCYVVQNFSSLWSSLLWLAGVRLISLKCRADLAVWEESILMVLLYGCALKLDRDKECCELNDGTRGKSWATTESQWRLRSQRVSQRVKLMEPKGDINPSLANTHLDWTLYLQSAYTRFQEIPSSQVLFILKKYYDLAAYKQIFEWFHAESNEQGQKSLLSPAAAGLKIHFA